MISEKEELIQEIMFGTTFQKPFTNTPLKNNNINDDLTLFSQLCGEKLNLSYDENEIVDVYSFIEKVSVIFSKNPMIEIRKFVNDFVSGVPTKDILSKHLIPNYTQFYPVLKILGLKNKRIKSNNQGLVTDQNLENFTISNIHEFYNKYSIMFEIELMTLSSIAWIRLNALVHIISNQNNVTIQESALIEQSLLACKNMTFKTDEEYKKIINFLNKLDFNPLDELFKKNILIKESSSIEGKIFFSVNPEFLQFEEFILTLMKNSNGVIMYSNMVDRLFEKNPLCHYVPLEMLWIGALSELEKQNKIKRNIAFSRWSPYQDQYTLNEIYDKNIEEIKNQLDTQNSTRLFFGREVDPTTFLRELDQLEKGDLDDNDDQITRIAGMVLANSSMLKTPYEGSKIFDFMIDLSNYEFTEQQQSVMNETNVIISSQIVHIKVMIDELITLEILRKIKNDLPSGEQAMIITITPPDHFNLTSTRAKLPKNNSITIIDRVQFEAWLKITPIIPSRKNSICRIKYGKNIGKIVKITSVNYETAMATVNMFPENIESSEYIGALEELIPNVTDTFFYYLSQKNYSEILLRFAECSTYKDFNDAMALKIKSVETLDQLTTSRNTLYVKKYTFENDKHIVIINDIDSPKCNCNCNGTTLKNRNDNLFCLHQIAAFNKKCFDDALYNETWNEKNILTEHFMNIENPSNSKKELNTTAQCPQCTKIVDGFTEIEKYFGFRTADGITRCQSWCRDCRNKPRNNKDHLLL